jgi:hypothetical protein
LNNRELTHIQMENNKDKIVEIYSGTLWESEMITTLLKEEGIESFLKNSVLNTYAYDPAFSQEVKVMICESDYEGAKRIVDEYCLNRNNAQ